MSRTALYSRISCCCWPKAWATSVHRERLRTPFRRTSSAASWYADIAREMYAPICARNGHKSCRWWSYRFRRTVDRRSLSRAAWLEFLCLERISGDAPRLPDPWNVWQNYVTNFRFFAKYVKRDRLLKITHTNKIIKRDWNGLWLFSFNMKLDKLCVRKKVILKTKINYFLWCVKEKMVLLWPF
jgi:hypothetical protein